MSQSTTRRVSVLIASTLKPIRDVRAFEKLALSLGETNTYELNIIGFSPKKPKSTPGIRFFRSMSHFDSPLDRILAQGRFLRCLMFVRPKVLICCTYELLPLASFFKPFLGYKLVYDVQENYVANLDLNNTLSPEKKERASKLISRAESVSGIDLFLMAEKCYVEEMPQKRPFQILENKFHGEMGAIRPVRFHGKNSFRFCISGTITPAFGTWEAVCWFTEILKAYPQSELEIVGHCPIKQFQTKLVEISTAIPQILLRTKPHPVPHEDLIEAMKKADFVLLPYQNHPAISAKIPTKLFECAALGIPVLISHNPLWEVFLADFQGGFPIDFSLTSEADRRFETALTKTYFSSPPPENILWKTEKPHFQQAIQDLLS